MTAWVCASPSDAKTAAAVLNSCPLWLADKMNDIRNVDYGLLWFTDESKEECARVISDYCCGEKAPRRVNSQEGCIIKELL